ncbi:MAG: hypothetical protein ACR2FI_02870 [Burkholderiales bacterium]|nr:hypothetical protein [Pseudomonadota bacterium]
MKNVASAAKARVALHERRNGLGFSLRPGAQPYEHQTSITSVNRLRQYPWKEIAAED